MDRNDKPTATGEGVSRAPCNNDYQFFPVWRDSEGAWWRSHPTDDRGPWVRFEGVVRDVVETVGS